MPGAGKAEVLFILAMMIVIVLICVVAVYFFVKTYRKEMREKEARMAEKAAGSEPSDRSISADPK